MLGCLMNVFNWNIINPRRATISQHKLKKRANVHWTDTSGGDTRAAIIRDINSSNLRLSVSRRGLRAPRWKEIPNTNGNCKITTANKAILRLRSMYGPILACSWIDTAGSVTSKVSKTDAAWGRTILYVLIMATNHKAAAHQAQHPPSFSL